MTQLIIDLYQHDFNPNVEAESVEAALGQFLAQQDLRFRSVHVQGKAAYVEVADGESAEMAATALDGMLMCLGKVFLSLFIYFCLTLCEPAGLQLDPWESLFATSRLPCKNNTQELQYSQYCLYVC